MRPQISTISIVATLIALIALSAVLFAQDNGGERDIPDEEQLEAFNAGAIDFGRELVSQRCANCHATEPGQALFAPTLVNLIGRKAGSVEGFPYSAKIKMLDFVWTPKTLDGWLKTITVNTPYLRMRHVGVKRDDEREAIIAYLKVLSK